MFPIQEIIKALQQQMTLHYAISQYRSPRASAHLRALSAARGTKLKIIWNSKVKMIRFLKVSSSQLDEKTPSHIIWEKSQDTRIGLLTGCKTGRSATHFGLERMSLPVSFSCFKSHESIRSLLETSINFTEINHCLWILGPTPRHHLWITVAITKTIQKWGGHRLDH